MNTTTNDITLISEPRVRMRLGDISSSTLLRLRRADPSFPKAIRITPNRVGYCERDFCAWLQAKAATQ